MQSLVTYLRLRYQRLSISLLLTSIKFPSEHGLKESIVFNKGKYSLNIFFLLIFCTFAILSIRIDLHETCTYKDFKMGVTLLHLSIFLEFRMGTELKYVIFSPFFVVFIFLLPCTLHEFQSLHFQCQEQLKVYRGDS